MIELPARADEQPNKIGRAQLPHALWQRRSDRDGSALKDSKQEAISGCVERSVKVGGIQRTYLLHTPASFPLGTTMPLVMVFDGGFGDRSRMSSSTRFNQIADREHFFVLYPNGVHHHWNDGLGAGRTAAGDTDDVAFVRALIDEMSHFYNIDQKRIYATGISKGANLSHKLGAELSDKIAAIAPVAGCIGMELAAHFDPAQPVSVLQIHGTDDRSIQWNGGKIAGGTHKGETLSVADTINLWRKADGCNSVSTVPQPMADTDPTDGTTASMTRYTGGWRGTEIELIKIQGGGHDWPGMSQTSRGILTGKISRDFNASEVIWAFFKSHPKQ